MMKIIAAAILTLCCSCATTSIGRHKEIVEVFGQKGYQVLNISPKGEDYTVTLLSKTGMMRSYDVYQDKQGALKTYPDLN